MEKQNLPKLNNISYNKDARIRLLKSKPYVGTNGQGEYRMWTFRDLEDNETKVFFANEDAHAVLQNVGEGSELILRKVPIQDGSKISPKFELTVVNAVSKQENGRNGKADNFKEVMLKCVQDAVAIANEVKEVPFQTDDIRSIAATLFIGRTKMGL